MHKNGILKIQQFFLNPPKIYIKSYQKQDNNKIIKIDAVAYKRNRYNL